MGHAVCNGARLAYNPLYQDPKVPASQGARCQRAARRHQTPSALEMPTCAAPSSLSRLLRELPRDAVPARPAPPSARLMGRRAGGADAASGRRGHGPGRPHGAEQRRRFRNPGETQALAQYWLMRLAIYLTTWRPSRMPSEGVPGRRGRKTCCAGTRRTSTRSARRCAPLRTAWVRARGRGIVRCGWSWPKR